MNTREEQFKAQIAAVLKTDAAGIHLYWKGRVALYALFKAAGIKAGDEVIIPGFTCVVVPNAVIYTGAVPVYVDIQRNTLNPSFADIKAAVTPVTRVIILQNTFGLSTDLEQVNDWARAKGILTFEDCTHGFGGFYNGRPNGTFCDAAFFSTQWNKPFSTGIGGFSAVFNSLLAERLHGVNKALVKPGFMEDFQLQLLIWSRRFLLSPVTYYFLRNLYRFMSRFNLAIGSSSGDELKAPSMPASYFKAMGKTQVRNGLEELRTLDKALLVRKNNSALYTRKLAQCGKYHVSPELHENHCYLKYPILVSDKNKFTKAAQKEGIGLGDWFVSPIHPVEKDFEKWHLSLESIPVAADLSAKVLNLPTDTAHPDRVLAFIDKNIGMIL